jgi:hypothetical protein
MAGIIKVDRVQSDSNLAFNIAGANVAFMDASALRLVGSGITANGSTIFSNSKVVNTAMPVGSIIQVVQAVKTDTFSTTNDTTGWVDITGLSVSITPISASNKILVFVDTVLGASTSTAAQSRLLRGSTPIYEADAAGSRPSSLTQIYAGATEYFSARTGGTFLDSPATTSATTYKLQLASSGAGTAVYVNRTSGDRNTTGYDSRSASSITVMEIVA